MAALASTRDLVAESADFVTASADHQDACFRLLQYTTKLIATFHYGAKRHQLASLSGQLDSARALTRCFGSVYVIKSLLARNQRPHSLEDKLSLAQDMFLVAYHPLEALWWLMLASASSRTERRRTLARLVAALGLGWNVCRGLSAYLRLRALRSEDGAGTVGFCRRLEDESDGFSDEVEAERRELRRLLVKLALDSALAVHWTLDSPRHGLSEWQVGLIGTASAGLGLGLQYRTHAAMLRSIEEEEWAPASTSEVSTALNAPLQPDVAALADE